uniref:Uncharacterized protein n=1 Tax=Tetradesmus obliquus TaxID=3088 RepID=A0A383VJP9_TETOB
MSAGFVLKPTKAFLDVPFGKHTPIFVAVTAAVFGMSWLNSFAFKTPHTFSPEFLAEQAKIGNVMERTNAPAERTNAPAVFLNPIMNKIPGNILGPDDVPN